MKISHNLFLFTVWMLANILAVKAQSSYIQVGSSKTSLPSDCYFVTQEMPGKPQTSAVWNSKTLDITDSFDMEFTVNFGANPNGADGVALVLQTSGLNALGGAGSGIGYRGLKPSLGIEFDTHRNGELGDPDNDHIALVRDGQPNHQLNSGFAPPVPILTNSKNAKDGRDHFVKLTWNATTRSLKVYVDCVQKVSQSVDLVNDIFKGVGKVYWGITASTGTAGNAHTVCLPENIIVRNMIRACPTDKITLIAGMAIDDKYEWKPQQGLSNPSGRVSELVVTRNQVYTVTYTDRCSVRRTDSVLVKLRTPDLTLGGDRQICENEAIDLMPVLTPATTTAVFQWSTGDTTRQLKLTTSGLYKLRVTIDGCSVSDSALVTIHPLPKSGLLNEPIYNCLQGSSILLDPQSTGENLQFLWTPGGTIEPTLSATEPGQYTVSIKNAYGCLAQQRFTILNNCPSGVSVFIPDAFTPNGDGINEVFEWKSNTQVESRMTIYNRWGSIIFSSTDSRTYWDGTSEGSLCPPSLYTWRLDYRLRQGNEKQWFVKSGEVALVR